MVLTPQRTRNHEIDTEACKIVTLKFDRDWEVRDITGRDFGVDKIVERFESGNATSELIMLQIKGTETEIDVKNPRFSLPTKTLLYAEMFASPFLLVYCSITNPEQCYYVWLQEYIRVRLNFENKNWRNQGTNTIYFPVTNILGSDYSIGHLQYISKFPKFKDSWVEYYVSVTDLGYYLPNVFCYEEMNLADIKYSVKGIVKHTEDAIEKSTYIPQEYLSQNMQELINLVKEIEDCDKKPELEDYRKIIKYCSEIKLSMEAISLRFDSSHLRFLYEIEGCIDF